MIQRLAAVTMQYSHILCGECLASATASRMANAATILRRLILPCVTILQQGGPAALLLILLLPYTSRVDLNHVMSEFITSVSSVPACPCPGENSGDENISFSSDKKIPGNILGERNHT